MNTNINPIVIVEDPQLNFSYLTERKEREKGLSGLLRVRNEEEYLAQSIDSVIEVVDELIIVYNNCQDSSPEIIQEYANRYPKKIKAFHYVPIVYPPHSTEFHQTPGHSQHSLAYYYNFTLQQASYRYLVKIDGDIIFHQLRFKQAYLYFRKLLTRAIGLNSILNSIRGGGKQVRLPMYCINGPNVIAHRGEIFINQYDLGAGLEGDIGFFAIDMLPAYFKNSYGYEQLVFYCNHKLIKGKNANQSCFVHVKRSKANFGFDNQFSYDLSFNKLLEISNDVTKIKLMPFAVASEKHFKNLPLGFFTINEKYLKIDYQQGIEEFIKQKVKRHPNFTEKPQIIDREVVNPIIKVSSPQLNDDRLRVSNRLPGKSNILLLIDHYEGLAELVEQLLVNCNELLIFYHQGIREAEKIVQQVANTNLVYINPYYYDIAIDIKNQDPNKPSSKAYLEKYAIQQSNCVDVQVYNYTA